MWTYLIAGLLVVHGLIHGIGVATTLAGAQLEGFSGVPTVRVGGAEPAVAALWSVALLGMLVAAGGVVLDHAWWRPVAIVTAAVSMVPIVVWWQDAKFGALANLLVVAVALAAPRMTDVAA